LSMFVISPISRRVTPANWSHLTPKSTSSFRWAVLVVRLASSTHSRAFSRNSAGVPMIRPFGPRTDLIFDSKTRTRQVGSRVPVEKSTLLDDSGFHPQAGIAPKCVKLRVCVGLRKDGNKLHGRAALGAPCLGRRFVRDRHRRLPSHGAIIRALRKIGSQLSSGRIHMSQGPGGEKRALHEL
jgi:hypothetical protein